MTDTTQKVETPTMRKLYKAAVFIAVAILVAKSIASGWNLDQVYAAAGSDSVMRLMSVRDWMAGQGWFDMYQYRILPETGLSLHWSRYLDAGIGAIIGTLALVFPMQTSEQLAAILWPLGLSICLVAFVGHATRHLYGNAAAAIAVLMVICYPPLVLGYFGPAQLDHHNVQILLMTIAALALAQADRPGRLGVVAGLAAAASLAVGLETLFMVVAISLFHVCDVVIAREGARQRLLTYALTIMGASAVFFVGQTPPAEWFIAYCDELSTPMIAIALIGGSSGLAGLAITHRSQNRAVFLTTVGVVVLTGIVVAWPLLGPCFQSPYANLPVETQSMIASRIIEAQPLTVFFEQSQTVALSYFGPALAVMVLATAVWAYGVWTGRHVGAAGHLILLGWIGFLAAFWQMRQIVIFAAVVPALTGYVVGPILMHRLAARSGKTQLALYAVCAVTLFQPVLLIGAEGALVSSQVSASAAETSGQPRQVATGQDEACYDLEGLQKLNALSPQTILTNTNLGPRLIMATHHTGLAAPYHRSNAAFTNGFSLQITEPKAFAERLTAFGAAVVVTCRGSIYGTRDSVGSRLAADDAIDGFTKVELDDPNLMVFQYDNGKAPAAN